MIKIFQFLLQDASVQAFQNVGGQPWTGLDSRQTQGTFESLISEAQFLPVTSSLQKSSLFEVAKSSKTYRLGIDQINTDTLSAIPIFTQESSMQYYLLT